MTMAVRMHLVAEKIRLEATAARSKRMSANLETLQHVLSYGLLFGYFALIALIGLRTYRRTRTVEDFAVGGRSVGPLKTAFSYAMTNFSAGIYISFAGMTGWRYGMSALSLAVVGSTLLATYLPWKLIAARVWQTSKNLNVMTIPGYLEKRFGSPAIKVYGSVLMFVFFVPYAASLMMGFGYLFEQVFGIGYSVIIVLMVVFTAFYLFFGGYLAVASVGMAQGVILLVASLVVVAAVTDLPQAGGVADVFARLGAIDPELVFATDPSAWLGLLVIALSTGLGPWGMPDMLQRFQGMKCASSFKSSRRICVALSLAVSLSAYFLGGMGRLFFTDVPTFGGAASTDLIVPMMIGQLDPMLASLFVVLTMAASMSTMAAIILSASSSVGIDIIVGRFFPEMPDRLKLLMLRVLSAVFLLAVLVLALFPLDAMFNLISLTVGVISGTFFAPFIYGLYSKRVNGVSVAASMATAAVIAIGGFICLQYEVIPRESLVGTLGMPFFSTLAITVPMIVLPLAYRLSKGIQKPDLAGFAGQFAQESPAKAGGGAQDR
jgi:Na+/proline symporter